jgi:hypothetical protein
MKERILHIQLTKNLILRDGKRQDQSNRSRFYNQTKSVIIVDSKMLLEAFGHQQCFMPIHRRIGFVLDLVYPLAIYEISVGLWRNYLSCFISEKGITLILHGRLPLREG